MTREHAKSVSDFLLACHAFNPKRKKDKFKAGVMLAYAQGLDVYHLGRNGKWEIAEDPNFIDYPDRYALAPRVREPEEPR